LDAESQAVRGAVLGAVDKLFDSVHGMRLDQGLAEVLNAVKRVNKYLEVKQPWTLAKQSDPSALHECLYVSAEALRILSQLLQPVMPAKMEALRTALGLRGPCALADLRVFGKFTAGREVAEPGPLFPRIERAAPAAESVVAPVTRTPGVEFVEYADFQKIRLQTARILTAEKIAGADKLLRLQVEVGAEPRQIVAGIAQHYQPEDLPGRLVVLVSNLKPAKIRGVESNGMLLAASSEGKLRLITVDDDIGSGAAVK